jgi:glutamate synthase domain-containing protein 1
MVIGEKDDMVYMASEESAIRAIESNLDKTWSPKGGEAVIIKLNEGVN